MVTFAHERSTYASEKRLETAYLHCYATKTSEIWWVEN